MPRPAMDQRLRATAARGTLVVAHRGDAGSYPENTLASFEAALRTGAPLIELDFHQTRDGVLVCIHDETLDRTTDAIHALGREGVRVRDRDFAELAGLDAGSWWDARFADCRVPPLEMALTTIQRQATTMIEHKSGDPSRIVDLLAHLRCTDQVLLQSFDWTWLRAVHRLEPALMLGALGGSDSCPHIRSAELRSIASTHAGMVHWAFEQLTADDVGELHEHGYLVCVYTIDTPSEFARAIEMKVDAITTNQPAQLLRFLQARGGASADPTSRTPPLAGQ